MKISKNTLIIGLIVLNIGVVIFFLLNKRPHSPHGPREKIINILSLNDEQINSFDNLIESHQEKRHVLSDNIQEAKKEVYKNILDKGNDQDSLLEVLGKKYIALEKLHIQHLNDIKKILSKDQIPAFKRFFKHVDRVFHPHPPKPFKH
jgi:hypothetical protein